MSETPARILTATPPLPCGECGHHSLRLTVLVAADGRPVGHQVRCSICQPPRHALGVRRPLTPATYRQAS
jgi:hypothetical protein